MSDPCITPPKQLHSNLTFFCTRCLHRARINACRSHLKGTTARRQPRNNSNITGYGSSLTPGADLVKLVAGTAQCLDEVMPVDGTTELLLAADLTVT